jgi:hypothetical protein
MKEREFKKLVFENFVQAKKELIREGYIKRSDNLNFEDVFSETKKRVLEERVKSLQRENEMLKNQLKGKGLQEAGSMSAAGQGGAFQGNAPGSKEVGTGMDKIGAFFKDKGSIATLATKELDKAKFFDRMMDRYPNTSKKGLIDAFRFTMVTNLKNGMSKDEAKRKAMADMDNTLAENRRRRRY